MKRLISLAVGCLLMTIPALANAVDGSVASVNVHNFIRAETDFYFGQTVKAGAFSEFRHRRTPAAIDKQDVVRMNRDTLYSSAVFDLDAAPLTVELPDPGKRFMSMQVISQDHYTIDVVYGPGRFTYDRVSAGTRYIYIIVRTLANAEDSIDTAAVNGLQDKIKVEQARKGSFEIPQWDAVSQGKVRDALSALGAMGNIVNRFGSKAEVDPIDHLIGTATGWGGNPRSAADYQSFYPAQNDGKTSYELTVRDVPVDGFWSVSVYNAKGYFEKNDRNAYSLNNLTARPNTDGSFTIRFGGCRDELANCLPIVEGWNYTVRLYRPRPEVINGSWRLPEPVLAQ